MLSGMEIFISFYYFMRNVFVEIVIITSNLRYFVCWFIEKDQLQEKCLIGLTHIQNNRGASTFDTSIGSAGKHLRNQLISQKYAHIVFQKC